MEQNEILEKVFTFFRNAVKKYDEGNIDGALSDIEWGNEALDEFDTDDLDAPSEDEVLGENRNFGKMYQVIEENATKMYESKEGRKRLSNIIRLIQENDTLRKQFDVYSTLTNMSTSVDVDNYLKEAISLIPLFDKNELFENNQKLFKLIKGYNLSLDVPFTAKEKKLYESIEFIISNQKNLSNLSNYQLAENTIKERINENIANLNENVITEDINEVFENKLEKLNEKYNTSFNDDEIKFLKQILSEETDREKYLNEYKEKLITKLNKLIKESNENDAEAWNTVLENISNMSFVNGNTDIENIAKLIEINNRIDD